MKIMTDGYRCLELFVKTTEGQPEVILTGNASRIRQEISYPCQRVCFSVDEESVYEVEVKNCSIELAYLSECRDIMERGVMFLESGERVDGKKLKKWYDTPMRGQYHFGPFKNWMNDPNGLCWYQGYYHIYYQFNPFGQQWDNMYWGHAASRDLVHWIHLPVCLEPQPELLENETRKGGAFSGSALAGDKEIEFFLTRHNADPVCEERGIEYQVTVRSRDGIHFGAERTIISRKSGEFSYDFRDPKAFWFQGRKMLVLGSRNHGAPAILLYEEQEGEWNFQGSLLEEHQVTGIRTFECPDFFALDGTYVAVAAYMQHVDKQGRKQGTYYYTGDFDGRKFDVKSCGLYDFGSNFYAVQSFEHDGRRIAIGWISDFWNEYRESDRGANGSMSIPRELHVKNGRLYQTPVREIYSLIGETLYEGAEQKAEVKLSGNSWYTSVCLKPGSSFEMILAEEGKKQLKLTGCGSKTVLRSVGTAAEGVSFEAETAPVTKIEIFMDRKVCEIFINDGEAVGAKLFYKENAEGVFKAEFQEMEDVKSVSVCRMHGIW